MCKDCGASFVRRGNLKNHIVKCHPDDPMLTSKNRDRTEGKVECSGEVKEMHKEMTGNSGKVEVVEEVEQDTVVAIEKESYEIPIVKQKEAVAESLKEMVESVSKQEMTWGEMEISFVDSSVQKLEEPSARLQDFAMDEMEECILTLSDLPVKCHDVRALIYSTLDISLTVASLIFFFNSYLALITFNNLLVKENIIQVTQRLLR